MIKGNTIIGLKLITITDGKEITTIKDVVYDPQAHKVKALLIDEGGWLSDAKIVLVQDIHKVGEDAVIIQSENVIKKASEVSERIASIAKDSQFLTNTKIVSEDGKDLGKISDIYFELPSGNVIEFEVSQGLKDLSSGKKRIKVSDIITIGEDATIVKHYVDDTFAQQSQQQGITGVVHQSKNTVGTKISDAKEKTPSMIDLAREKFEDATQKAQVKIEEFSTNTKEKAVATKDSDTTQQRLDSAKNFVKEGFEKTKTTTMQVTDETKQQTAAKKEEMEINKQKSALGKYVTINVLGKDDTLLARRGEMITHRLLDDAQKHEMLDQVLSNTSDKPIEPSIPIEIAR